MDIRQYIESGILEQYVLGQLDQNQQAEVERMAREHPEIRQELNSIEAALESYVQAYAKTPPAGVKANVMDEVRNDLSAGSGSGGGFLKYFLLAASFVILAGLLWYVYSQNRLVTEQNEELQIQLDTAEARLNQLTEDCEEINRRYTALTAPGTRSILMAGTDLSPDSRALVFYNAEHRNSYLSGVTLPAPPSGSQYQLWAIVDGQPVDMGVIPIEVDPTAFIDIPYVENAQAFAVTLERAGGSPTPTLDHMYVLGQI